MSSTCWGAGCALSWDFFLDANAATAWRVSSSAKAGISLETGPGGNEIGFALIGHSGLSTQRQFFRAESRCLGVEVRVDL